MLRLLIAALLCLALPSGATYAQALPIDSESVQLLQEMLGTPGGDGPDARILANSERIRRVLPGRWLIADWMTISRLMPGEQFQTACERSGQTIRPSSDDSYAYDIERTGRNGDHVVERFIWTGGNRFARVRNIDASLDFMALPDSARQNLGSLMTIIDDASTIWTLLTLTDDAILLVSGDVPMPNVMLRCERVEVAAVTLLDACRAAVIAEGSGQSAQAIDASCRCAVEQLSASPNAALWAPRFIADFAGTAASLQSEDSALFQEIGDTCF